MQFSWNATLRIACYRHFGLQAATMDAMLHTVLQCKTHFELARHLEQCFFNLLCNILLLKLLRHHSHEKLLLTLPKMNMSRKVFSLFVFFLAAMVVQSRITFYFLKRALQRNFCETGLFQGVVNNVTTVTAQHNQLGDKSVQRNTVYARSRYER